MSDTSNKPAMVQVPPAELIAEKTSECTRIVPAAFHVFVGALQRQFGDSIQAVLLYGSCLHNYDLENSIVDLYVVVDEYEKGLRQSNSYDAESLCTAQCVLSGIGT